MNKKDIYIIAFISVILSALMIFFHSNRNSTVILDKSSSTKKEDNLIENTNTTISGNPDNVTNDKVVVYISGEVVNPQVVEMKKGERLIDAIEKCGGMTENADKNAINLALLLNDEDHYVVPKIGEELQINISNSNNKKSNLININTADKETLMTLPSFGEKMAERIISYREDNGKFENIEDIKNVSGIGDKKFEQVKDLITVR